MSGLRIQHDASRCASLGMCEAVEPDVFELGADGELVVHQPDGPQTTGHRALLEQACEACPTGALSLLG